MVPVPYNIHDIVEHDENFTSTVRFTGQKAMVFRSRTSHVHGNEQGSGGGVKSGTTSGPCEPIGHASQLNAEGSPVIRHLDRFWMNNRNTIGEGRFVKDTKTYKPPEDDDPVPGSVEHFALADDKKILTDASPDPSFSRPGAKLAFVDESGKFGSGATTAPPQPAPPKTADPAPSQRRGTWGRPVGSAGRVGGWAGALGALGAAGVANRLNRLQSQLQAQGVEIDRSDPAQEQALRDYSDNLGGTSFLRRNVFPPMSAPEAMTQLKKSLAEAKAKKEAAEKDAEPKAEPQAPPQSRTGARVDERPECRSERICFDKVESSHPDVKIKFDEQLKMQEDTLNAKTPAQVVADIP